MTGRAIAGLAKTASPNVPETIHRWHRLASPSRSKPADPGLAVPHQPVLRHASARLPRRASHRITQSRTDATRPAAPATPSSASQCQSTARYSKPCLPSRPSPAHALLESPARALRRLAGRNAPSHPLQGLDLARRAYPANRAKPSPAVPTSAVLRSSSLARQDADAVTGVASHRCSGRAMPDSNFLDETRPAILRLPSRPLLCQAAAYLADLRDLCRSGHALPRAAALRRPATTHPDLDWARPSLHREDLRCLNGTRIALRCRPSTT